VISSQGFALKPWEIIGSNSEGAATWPRASSDPAGRPLLGLSGFVIPHALHCPLEGFGIHLYQIHHEILFRGMITEEVLPTIEGWREILVAGLFALQLPNPARLSDNHIPRWRSNGKSPASL